MKRIFKVDLSRVRSVAVAHAGGSVGIEVGRGPRPRIVTLLQLVITEACNARLTVGICILRVHRKMIVVESFILKYSRGVKIESVSLAGGLSRCNGVLRSIITNMNVANNHMSCGKQ